MSAVIRATCGEWTTLLAGDLSADGIRQMLAAGINVLCDIFKILWHGDRGAIITKPSFAEKMGMIVAYSQYHKKESKSNGRQATYDILRKAGAFVARVCEDGDISMIMQGKTLTVTTTKGIKKVFTKK
jgi:beta-lactamase superfamily II metal-dependent hydrolase